MSRGSPANFLREQRPRPRSVRTAPHFRGWRERPHSRDFHFHFLLLSFFLVRVSYLNRRPFYGLRTRPPLPLLLSLFCLNVPGWLGGLLLPLRIYSWLASSAFGERDSRPCSLRNHPCVPPCEVVRHNMQSVRHLPRKCHVASIQFPASHLLSEHPLMMSAEWFD